MAPTSVRRRPSGKARDVIDILDRRIRGGDYLVAPLPSTRDLAAELGVSYVTARKALLALQESGLLARGATRRLMLASKESRTRVRQIAYLATAYPSPDVVRWQAAINRLVTASGCAFKAHFYMHWDDPVLLDIVERGDGAFLHPSSQPLSSTVERLIRSQRHRLVVVDQDWSHLGLPSICLCPAHFMGALFDHCIDQGHQRIACFNTQPHDAAITARIQHFQLAAERHGIAPLLIDEPVQPGEDQGIRAREVMARLLEAGRPAFTSLITTTVFSALGAIRSLVASGILSGRDLAVCTLNDEGLGDLLVPSLTAQITPDPAPFIKRGLSWILHAERAWRGRLLQQPEQCDIAARESTSAAGTPTLGRRARQ